jgi:hypothetical protein
MTKKQHTVEFERFIIENNSRAVLLRADVIKFNKIDSEINLFLGRDYFTLYKIFGTRRVVIYVDSFNYDDFIRAMSFLIARMILTLDDSLCDVCLRRQISHNDDGEEIIKDGIPIKDMIGIRLKIKKYGHTGFLK